MWVGLACGAALGLGGIVAVDAATGPADAQGGFKVTPAQLQINQKISQAAVRRANRNRADIQALQRAVGTNGGATGPTGPQGAPGSQGERGERGPQGPAGSAAAVATVAADGTVDPSRSALSGGRVVKAQGAASVGFYCVYDLPFTPKSAVASANIDPSRFNAPPNPPFRAGAMTYVMRPGDPNPISGCALDGLQVVINTYAAQDADIGDSVDYPFSLWIED